MNTVTQKILLQEVDNSVQTVYTSSSISPSPDKLILCFLTATDNGFAGPILVNSITGAGLTWVEIAEVQMDTIASPRQFLTCYRAMGPAPTPGALTITLDGPAFSCQWIIVECGNVDTGGADGADAVVQVATNVTDSGTSIIGTLAAFADVENATIGAFAAGESGVTDWVAGTGFTELAQGAFSDRVMMVEFRSDNDTTVDATADSTAKLAVIAIELKFDPQQLDIVPTLLTEGSSESDSSSYATASISPTAQSLVLAFVNQVTATAASGSNVPTCSGAGMTWVQVATQAYDSENPDRGRFTMFRALDAAPGSGALTFSFGGETQARASWGIVEFENVDIGGADGADAIVQVVQGEKLPAASDADLPLLTLATFDDLENATFGAIGVGFPDVTVTVGQGFVEQNNIAVGGNGSRTQSQFRPTNHVGVEWTLGALGTESGFFAVELRNITTHVKIGIELLTSGQSETDTTVYSTASISPNADRVLLAIVHGLRLSVAANSVPTCAGLGLTWVEVATKAFSHGAESERSRMTIFRAIGPGPTTGAVSFTFPETQARGTFAVLELKGTEIGGGDGADAIVQAVVSAETTTSPVTATLAAFNDPANATFGGSAWSVGDPGVAPGTGFTELSENRLAPNGTGLQTQFRPDNDTTVDVIYSGLPITDFFTVAFGIELANAIATAAIEKVAADTLGLAIINEAGEVIIDIPVEDVLDLALVEAPGEVEATALSQADQFVLQDFGEFGVPLGFQVIEPAPDLFTLADQPVRQFPEDPVSTAKTLIIAEIKLDSGTLFQASKGIRHPLRMYRGRVKSFGSIIRTVQVPSGFPQIGDAELTIVDTDGELRRLLSSTPPQNREVVVKIGSEGASEAIFQVAYTGIIVHATFPPGLAKIQLQDNTLKFLNEQLPDLLTRDNFIPDPLFAKNLRSRSEGRFEESEIFAPIVFGRVESTGFDVIGSINAVRLDSTTFNLAQHPIDHSLVRIFIKDPDNRPEPDQEFIELIGGFSIVEVAKTIQGIDYIFTQVVFGSARAAGYEVRWDGEGMTDTGDQFGTAFRNPAEAIKQYLIRIARRDPGTELDLIGIDETAQQLDDVTTGGPVPGFFCDGVIAERMTHREALARMARSFGLFIFTKKDGRITLRYVAGEDPDRTILDDVQDIYVRSETHMLAKPIVNQVLLQYVRMTSEQSWQGRLTVDDDDSIDALQRTEDHELKLFFVRDDFVADKVARDFLQFTNPTSFRIVMTIPGHRRTADVELAQLIGVTNYSGLDPSGEGYDNKEFLIHKTEFATDTKQLKVHAIARANVLPFGLNEATSLEIFTVRTVDGLFTRGPWLELTGRPPLNNGFPNPVVLPFNSKWVTIQVAQGFGGFPGVVVPTIGVLDFGVGTNIANVVPILEGISILIDATGVDSLGGRMYSFPWQGFKKDDRLFVRAYDNLLVRDVLSLPQTHDWQGDITIWR